MFGPFTIVGLVFLGVITCIMIISYWVWHRSIVSAPAQFASLAGAIPLTDFEPLSRANFQALVWTGDCKASKLVLHDDRFTYATLYLKGNYLIGVASANGILTVDNVGLSRFTVRNTSMGFVVGTLDYHKDEIRFPDSRRYTVRYTELSNRGKGFFNFLNTNPTYQLVDSNGVVTIALCPRRPNYIVAIGAHALATNDLLILLVLGQCLVRRKFDFDTGA